MKRARWFVTFVALVALAGMGRAAELEARTYKDPAGKSIGYRLLVPKDYDAAKKYPLVLFLHGAGERGDDNKAQLVHGVSLFTKEENRAKFPCFVVAPQCLKDQQWVDMPWGTDAGKRPEKPSEALRLALGAVNAVAGEFSIDRSRLYVTGLSMGGYGTWDCITRYPGKFAAAAPVCGGGDPATITADVAKTPVWAFHSDDDTVVKVRRTREMVEALRKAGGRPNYSEYTKLGHFSWGRAYGEAELLPWMFAQELGKADAYQLKTPPPGVASLPPDADFPGEGPLRKADWFRNVWRERRTSFWDARERDQGAVVFLGDSITQGWGSLAKDFPDLKVANRGISGDLTRGVLYRLKEDVLDLKPRAVVLLIGTNDLEDKAEPKTVAANVKMILAALKAHDSKMPVIVCKVMPSHASMRRPAEKIRELNARVDELIQGDGPFIRCDTWSIFADAEGNAKKAEFPDLLHPNAAGYSKFADALRPILAHLDGRGR